MRFGEDECASERFRHETEWLETDGTGSYAAGTVAFGQTRRYHGLLVAADEQVVRRFLLVNGIDEAVERGGAMGPLLSFRLLGFESWPWPRWEYAIGHTRLTREVFLRHGARACAIVYRLEGLARPMRLRVRPLITARDAQGVRQKTWLVHSRAEATPGRVRWRPFSETGTIVCAHSGEYRHSPLWQTLRGHPVDFEREAEHREDAWAPGELCLEVAPDRPGFVVFGDESLEEEIAIERWCDQERHLRSERDDCPEFDPLVQPLWRGSQTFFVSTPRLTGLVAGFPDFGAWGRDDFTALPGLCLATGRVEHARAIFRSFARSLSHGLLPVAFDAWHGRPRYSAMDGSLWFVHALGEFIAYTGDLEFVRELWPALRAIVGAFVEGTRHHIRVERDGLVSGWDAEKPLTWMDAVTDRVVHTPRRGKPVEVQALWVRTLEVIEPLARVFGERELASISGDLHDLAVNTFRQRFWFEPGGYFFDVVDGEGGSDSSLRPNQLFALSLTDSLVEPRRAERMLDAVERSLLTPVGLRTLSPEDPRYCPRYEGDRLERGRAAHNGTVWPFLLGPFVRAWIKVHGDSDEDRLRARRFFDELEVQLGIACVDQLPEIFDGDAPHRPRGAMAQAWSNGEVLQTIWEVVLGHRPRHPLTRPPMLVAEPELELPEDSEA